MRHRTLSHLFGGEQAAASGGAPAGRPALLRLCRDKRGGVAVVAAVGLTSLLGVAGLVVEVGGWYVLRRNMQAAADAASTAGALKLDSAKSTAGVTAVAESVTTRNGFVSGRDNTTVSVESDLATGNVIVTVSRESRGALLSAASFAGAAKTVSARAVARVVDAGAPPCVLATTGTVSVGNNTDISAPKCGLASNSTSADAFQIGSGGSTGNGSGRITAANIVTHGGCAGCAESMGDRLTLTRSPVASSYAPKSVNPYAALDGWSPPASVSRSGCVRMPSAMPLNPGCYNSISSGSNSPVNLKPGVYYIRGGNLDVKGDLTCTTCTATAGVSIVLVGAGGGGAPGVVDINSQANIDLNASAQPTEPALNGVLIYRHAPNGSPANNGRGEIDINGGANLRLDGAIVGPTSALTMAGNAGTDPTACNVFVVASAEFRGNTSLSADGCDFYGTATGTPRMARLVQ